MRQRIANLTSRILNPFVVSLAAILLLSFKSASTVPDALKWSGVMAAASVLPVFLLVLNQARNGKLDGILNATRRQRSGIYLLSITCAAVGYVILFWWQAPALLQVAFVGGFSGAVVFAVINLRWKISLHTGFVSALVVVLVMVYGWVATVAAALVLLTAWSRTRLKYHSIKEVTAGALLGGLIVAAVFGVYGLF
jgi:membrane-associated phospholipid phosphatase